MSQDLSHFLRERSRLRVIGLSGGLALSGGLHLLALGLLFFQPELSPEAEAVKVTWVSLPPAVGGGTSGGSAAQEEGQTGERVRRVEEVAPKPEEPAQRPAPVATPNAFGVRKSAPVKGTHPDTSSMGKAPVASKGAAPSANPTAGAAGQGGGGGLGAGTGIPGLRASGGAEGGTGLIGDLEGTFPYTWYLQQVQNRITSNWQRISSVQGRVQIYFRIKRDGSLENVRVEIPSGNPGLDRSAELAVRRSDPLPRLPDGFEGSSLGVRFWFSYLGP